MTDLPKQAVPTFEGTIVSIRGQIAQVQSAGVGLHGLNEALISPEADGVCLEVFFQ